MEKIPALTFGSPPLARGKPRTAQTVYVSARITPACAGKTGPCFRTIMPKKDHPRLRGENAGAETIKAVKEGSPPLARGKPCHFVGCFDYFRITPACAGKTLRPDIRRSRTRDHPRLRGENLATSSDALTTSGSPPLARGKRRNLHQCNIGKGITPACAGKTRKCRV